MTNTSKSGSHTQIAAQAIQATAGPTEHYMFVGVDVAKDSFVSAQFGTNKLDAKLNAKAQTHDNSAAGIGAFVRMLCTALGKSSSGAERNAQCIVLMEATGGYERALAIALSAAGVQAWVVNPRQAAAFTKSMGQLAKTDHTDAKALACFAHTLFAAGQGEHLRYIAPSAHAQQLTEWVTRRAQLIEMRTMEGNRAVAVGAKTKGSIDKIIIEIERQLAEIDCEIDALMKEYFARQATLLDKFSGVGRVTLMQLCARVPELGHIGNKALAKLIGVAPLNCDSGKMHGKRTTWGGRADVRSALYMATLSAMRFDPNIKAMRERLLKTGKAKKVVIVACMHKMLSIINAVIKSGKPYDPSYPQP